MSAAGVGLQRWMTPRLAILGVVSLGLVGVVTFAMSRAVTGPSTVASPRPPLPGVRSGGDQDVQGRPGRAPARRLSKEPGGQRQNQRGRGQVLAKRVPAELRKE